MRFLVEYLAMPVVAFLAIAGAYSVLCTIAEPTSSAASLAVYIVAAVTLTAGTAVALVWMIWRGNDLIVGLCYVVVYAVFCALRRALLAAVGVAVATMRLITRRR